ncbi:hypothetical protein U3A55_11865 [Salarchaeum sp. III]|uniref:hypothetical protein n=1 Tax=Salarchaeum sp. III TaxID=3107927 RepID=UPI002ED8BDFA
MPEEFDVDVFRVLADPDDDMDYDGRLLGVGVDMPESDVYVDWRREAFPDALEDPHVSVYGSVEDLQKATGNEVEYIDSEAVATEDLVAASQQADPMTNGHDLDPGTGKGTCASTGKTIHAETMGDLAEDCPHCGDPLSVFGEETNEEASVDEVPATESDWSVRELDAIATEMDVLSRAEPEPGRVIWRSADQAVAYFADIPAKYTEAIGREAFVPPEAAADIAQAALDDLDGDDASEPARRARQLVAAHADDRPLPPEYVVEIQAFHADAGDDVTTEAWGGDAAAEWTSGLVEAMETVDDATAQEADDADAVAADGPAAPVAQAAVAASAGPGTTLDAITKAGSNELDVESLPAEYQQALEAEDFLVYGKASIEQYDRTDDPIKIEMEALEDALDRFFKSENAPGIISLYHDDIPVGVPVKQHELDEAASIQLESPDGEPEVYEFDAGDVLTTHVEDGDGDGRPELWLLSNLANDSEVAKQTRLRALEGDLNGYSVTIHRNRDEETETGRLVKKCDLHAVTLGEGEIVKNAGSTFGVAEYQAFTHTQ